MMVFSLDISTKSFPFTKKVQTMTVSYTGDVANASNFGIFVKILYKWRGSVYKLVYKELLAYVLCYFVINLTYRMVIVEYSEGRDAKEGISGFNI